ncbi:MAG: Indole-3-glycerol phosphate synthase [Chlamydiae bacterium]|nr:Indole-3-glycerol phosphate synthase [Chlamydiota bacterium]
MDSEVKGKKMITILDSIVEKKKEELEALLVQDNDDPLHPLKTVLSQRVDKRSKLFEKALCSEKLSVIAEIKRKSPSKGPLSPIENPVKLAHQYMQAGANALSILTDASFFGGSIEDLKSVSKTLNCPPILRKDFIIDPYQIAETKKMGATAILLIVAVVQKRLKEYQEIAHQLGLDCLVEVHNEEELEIALDAKSPIIGINNRNLKTFEVDLNISRKVIKKIPEKVIKVAESGIMKLDDAKQLKEWGFDCVLIGEMLVTASDPQKLIHKIRKL